MKNRGRMLAGTASIAFVATAVGAGWVLGPDRQVVSLFVIAAMAIAMSVTSLIANPRELLATLVLAVPVLVAAAIEGSAGWLVGPLAVLLLCGAELNALSWEFEGVWTKPEIFRRRTSGIATLATLGLVASLLVLGATRLQLFEGRTAIFAASIVLVALAMVTLPKSGAPKAP